MNGDLFERAMEKAEQDGSVQPVLGKSSAPVLNTPAPAINAPSVQTKKTNGARSANGAGFAGSNAVQNKKVVERKPLNIRLKTIGAQDYTRAGPNRSELVGTFRHIKRPLLANVYGHGVTPVRQGKRIQVTSALPGEGKTFTSIHLALSIAAEVDSKVILVDSDIIRPTVHSVLGIDQAPGIADWFADESTPIEQLVNPTNVKGLRILTSGKWKVNSAEVLASRSMTNFFNALTAAYPNDIIVVDSPPLLPASESATLAKNMGQVVLVVGAGATSQAQVNQALEMLAGDQAVSMVLNRSRNSSSYANYGY